jgi:hypothetical protein
MYYWKKENKMAKKPTIVPAAKDPGKGHFYVSLVKSIIRIVAGGFLITGNFVIAGALIITAELLGILEELV